MNKAEIYWKGESGKSYGYWIHPIDARFRKIAGNVILARKTENTEWEPLYIGQVRNFDVGLAENDKFLCARNNGATHAHVHFSSPDRQIRKSEVSDLIARWNPVCNGK